MHPVKMGRKGGGRRAQLKRGAQGKWAPRESGEKGGQEHPVRAGRDEQDGAPRQRGWERRMMRRPVRAGRKEGGVPR